MIPTILLAAPPASDWITLDFAALGQNFWSATFDGLTFGSIYALVALGYTLVYGVLNLINFAHSEVFIIGCYGVWFTLSSWVSAPPPPIWMWAPLSSTCCWR